uniref:Uncharacterized protein n=1 Tax=Peronospora matthiolae TaxID=2874970 RepID=A0AAV1U5V5_9STRA
MRRDEGAGLLVKTYGVVQDHDKLQLFVCEQPDNDVM